MSAASSTVVQLPTRATPTLLELEAKLVGAALHLSPTSADFAALDVPADAMSVELHRKAWGAAIRQADSGLRPTYETVIAAGLRRRALTTEECRQLENLALGNTLTLDRWRAVAADFKLFVQGQRTAAALEAEAQRIRQGAFEPTRTAGILSGIERELHRGAARIEDLTGDQERLLDRWDRHTREGTSELLATGIKVLDAEVGGLPQRLCLFAADAGVGKTALIDSMQHSMLHVHESLTLGLISPEDGVEHVPKRWMARETGWLLRDIGSRKLSAEEQLKVQEIAERHHALLKRILGYRERSITADQLIALCWAMVERGAGAVFIDNFNKITLRGGGDDYHERVQRFSDRLSEFAEKARVPAVLVVHLADAETNQRGKVTASGGLQGGKALGRDARFRIDLFRKDRELRGLIAKANELGEQGTVIQFSRQATAGLIDPDTGERVDVKAEAAAERQQRVERQEAERERLRKKRDALRAAAKTDAKVAEVAKAKAQQSLGADDWLLAAGDKRGGRDADDE